MLNKKASASENSVVFAKAYAHKKDLS